MIWKTPGVVGGVSEKGAGSYVQDLRCARQEDRQGDKEGCYRKEIST